MIPPRWVYRAVWTVHNVVDRISGGRLSTTPPQRGRLGVLFLETVGRRTGQPRRNALNYLEDGDTLVVVASNAGQPVDPSWWINLKAHPAATVTIRRRQIPVRARAATAEEAAAAWPRFIAASGQYEDYRGATDREIPVVVLERRG